MNAQRTLADAFDPARNSFNFLRLFLAIVVLGSHAFVCGGFGQEIIGHKSTPGTLAVYGFFGLSGFLIAGSAERSGAYSYIKRRVLRIYPAFWGVLVVTAFAIAPLTLIFRPVPDCDLWCYATSNFGPIGYVGRNFTLYLGQPTISGTPALLCPKWFASLWTLIFEFGCYMLLLGLALTTLLRRRWPVLLITALTWLALVFITSTPALNNNFSMFEFPMMNPITVLLPVFLTGSCLWMYRALIPDSGWIALSSTALLLGAFWLPFGSDFPPWYHSSVAALSPLLVYPLLWLGCHLRLHHIGRPNDYSYGIYLYAFPVQQLLFAAGIQDFGFFIFLALTFSVSVLLAFGSWHMLEKKCIGMEPSQAATGK
jgi:peptidoglycan/LPS O-acetylase OafA/YrhL